MANVNLYSIFLDYRGGTYISQVNSANAYEALEVWVSSLPQLDLDEWGLQRNTLLVPIREGTLVPLVDRIGVWCLSGVDDEGEQILINVVATVKN